MSSYDGQADVDPNDPSNPSNQTGGTQTPGGTGTNPLQAWARQALSTAYLSYLGRDISDAEFANYMGPNATQQSINQAVEAVRTSPESQHYQQANPGAWGHAPSATATPGGTTNTGAKGDYAAFGKAWGETHGKTAAELKAFVDAHPEYGAEIFGPKGNKVKIGNKYFKAISATSDPNAAANQWLDITNGEGGGGNTGLMDPTLYAPFTEQFDSPAPIDPFNFPDFVPPEQFHAPTKAEAEAEPGFAFRLSQGEGALQAAGAAKGLARSGGFYKGLIGFGQDFASNEYKNVFDRATSQYKTNFDAMLTSQKTNFDEARSEYDTKTHLADSNYDHMWKQYLERADVFYANQKNRYDRLYGNAQLGLNAQ